MSHTTIYFLAEAEDFDNAEEQVTAYLETESFFDYYNTLPDESGTLDQKYDELAGFLEKCDWRKRAEKLLEQAEEYKAAGNLCLYGYMLIQAGELYAQCLNEDTCVFNIDTTDYSIPTEMKGWWAIAVDFHY
jgi:hypothetical protein